MGTVHGVVFRTGREEMQVACRQRLLVYGQRWKSGGALFRGFQRGANLFGVASWTGAAAAFGGNRGRMRIVLHRSVKFAARREPRPPNGNAPGTTEHQLGNAQRPDPSADANGSAVGWGRHGLCGQKAAGQECPGYGFGWPLTSARQEPRPPEGVRGRLTLRAGLSLRGQRRSAKFATPLQCTS